MSGVDGIVSLSGVFVFVSPGLFFGGGFLGGGGGESSAAGAWGGDECFFLEAFRFCLFLSGFSIESSGGGWAAFSRVQLARRPSLLKVRHLSQAPTSCALALGWEAISIFISLLQHSRLPSVFALRQASQSSM